MAERTRIGLRDVRALGPNRDIWDTAVPGFGARRQRGEAIAYFVMYRTAEGRPRRYTIGRHGAPWTPETARVEARRLLGEVVAGGDPSATKHATRHAMTVAELCDRYLADAESGRLLIRGRRPKKPRTLGTDRGMIESHIKPLTGRLAATALKRSDVEKLMHDIAAGETARAPQKLGPRAVSVVRGGPGVASRTIGLLGAIFTYAVRADIRPDNPVRGVMRPADGRRERRLTDTEYAALGKALRSAETTVWPPAVACARFLSLTGWRSGEALGLRWADADLARRTATLPDSKTGRSMRPLSNAACDVLKGLTRGADAALVFPATRGTGTMTGFRKLWVRITKMGDLPGDVSPHTLRHSFASLAADLHFSESTIGTLIGHKSHTVTGRYTHSADAVLLAAADAVANETAARMGDAKPDATVVQLRSAG